MHQYKNGFTIVELLIALVVGSIIMTAIYAMINLGQGTSGAVSRRITTQQDTRAVLDLMAMEISMASYNPNMTNLTWTGSMANASCATPMVTARRGIQEATATNIGVAMDLGSNAALCPNPTADPCITDFANEYIVYIYRSAESSIRRKTNNCNPIDIGQIILGGTEADAAVRVRNSETSPVTPLFQYFDRTGVELVPPLTDANIQLIRRIRINIVGDDKVKDDKSGLYKVSRRTYSTDVLVRNHAMSP